MDEPFDGYDDLTVDEAQAAIEERDPDYDELRELHEYEYENANRVTLKSWIKDRSEEVEPEEEPIPPEELVVAPAGRRQYIAGIWFDHHHDHKTVEVNERVQRAVDDDLLRVVEDDR